MLKAFVFFFFFFFAIVLCYMRLAFRGKVDEDGKREKKKGGGERPFQKTAFFPYKIYTLAL